MTNKTKKILTSSAVVLGTTAIITPLATVGTGCSVHQGEWQFNQTLSRQQMANWDYEGFYNGQLSGYNYQDKTSDYAPMINKLKNDLNYKMLINGIIAAYAATEELIDTLDSLSIKLSLNNGNLDFEIEVIVGEFYLLSKTLSTISINKAMQNGEEGFVDELFPVIINFAGQEDSIQFETNDAEAGTWYDSQENMRILNINVDPASKFPTQGDEPPVVNTSLTITPPSPIRATPGVQSTSDPLETTIMQDSSQIILENGTSVRYECLNDLELPSWISFNLLTGETTIYPEATPGWRGYLLVMAIGVERTDFEDMVSPVITIEVFIDR